MDESLSPPELTSEPIAVRQARDIELPARDWLQRLFGRPLRDDEDVTIMLSAPRPAHSAADQRTAMKRLERVLDKSAANMHHVSEKDFNEAADEAMQHVRPTFEP